VKASENGADPVRFVGHSYDSARKNCEFAEEKSGAGEGNRTFVFVGAGQIIENRRKNARFISHQGAIRMTLYDNRPAHFFSAAMEFHGDSKAYYLPTPRAGGTVLDDHGG